MTDKDLYQAAMDFLVSFDKVTEDILQKHLASVHSKPKDLAVIYHRLCVSAQNKQMSTKVVGGSINGINNLGKVLFDFDPIRVAKTFGKTDKDKLLDKIIKTLNPSG
jgi:hypothetical protein